MRKQSNSWPILVLLLLVVGVQACTDNKQPPSSVRTLVDDPSTQPKTKVKLTEEVKTEEEKWLAELEANAASTSTTKMGEAQGLVADNAAVNAAVGQAVGRLNSHSVAHIKKNPQSSAVAMQWPPLSTPYTDLSLFDYFDDLCLVAHYNTKPPAAFAVPQAQKDTLGLNHKELAYPCVRSHYSGHYATFVNPNYLPLKEELGVDLTCDTGVASNRTLYEALISTHAAFGEVLNGAPGQEIMYIPSSPARIAVLEDMLLFEMRALEQEELARERDQMNTYAAALSEAFQRKDKGAVEETLTKIIALQDTQLESQPVKQDIFEACQYYQGQNPDLFTPAIRTLAEQVHPHYVTYEPGHEDGLSEAVITKLSLRIDSWPLSSACHNKLLAISGAYQARLAKVRAYQEAHLALVRGQAPVLSQIEREWLQVYFGELNLLEQELQTIVSQLEATIKPAASQNSLADFAAVMELERRNYGNTILNNPFSSSKAKLGAIRTHYGQLALERAAAFRARIAQQLVAE